MFILLFQLQSCSRRVGGYLCSVCPLLCSRQFRCLSGQRTKLQSQASAPCQRCPPVRLLAVYVCLGLGKYGLRHEFQLRSSLQPQINKLGFFSRPSEYGSLNCVVIFTGQLHYSSIVLYIHFLGVWGRCLHVIYEFSTDILAPPPLWVSSPKKP